MEIREVNYGIANNLGDGVIEINKNLKEYPELRRAILAHELEHTDTKGFTKEDFIVDLAPTKVNYWKLIVFMIRNPRSFLQLAPFYIKDKVFYYDINLIISWCATLGLIGIASYLALK
jgi:hypothetical protein